MVPVTNYGMSRDFPRELLVTVTFEVQATRTKLTLRYTGIPPGDISDATRAGWNESPDKYAGVLAVNLFKERKK